MNKQLELYILELTALYIKIYDTHKNRPTDVITYDNLIQSLDDLSLKVDELFERSIKAGSEWSTFADIGQNIIDIACRAAEINLVASRQSTVVRKPVSPLHTLGRLTLDAIQTASRYRKLGSNKYRTRLSMIQCAIDDLVGEAYAIEARRRY